MLVYGHGQRSAIRESAQGIVTYAVTKKKVRKKMQGTLYLSKKGEENGTRIVMTHLPNRKNPCLAVEIDNCFYKVASFNDEATADWFIEILEEILFGERRPDVRKPN